jgi:hypothetical protein
LKRLQDTEYFVGKKEYMEEINECTIAIKAREGGVSWQ